ncbi:MAG: helix-turn-helix transcriptional regulator [Eubacteriales bacterium]|nr:helix-turn-helix transcriptional regulator [Eubacteriales bacterium]
MIYDINNIFSSKENIIGQRLYSLRDETKTKVTTLAQYIADHHHNEIDTEGVRSLYYKWENGEKVPNLEMLLLICNFYNCEIDYILGKISEKNKQYADIRQATGLSLKSIARITSHNSNSPGHNAFLDTFITSDEYCEITHNMYWIENNCNNISHYCKLMEETKTVIENIEDESEFCKLDDMLYNYADKAEHNGNQILFLLYQCSLSFGNFLNKIKDTWNEQVKLTLKSLETPMPGLEK